MEKFERTRKEFKKLRERFVHDRLQKFIPLQYIGEYIDVFSAGIEQPLICTEHPLDLRNFTPDEINKIVRLFHDRWLTLVGILGIDRVVEENADDRKPTVNQLSDRALIEANFLIRFFEQELEYRPADANEVVDYLWKKLNTVNKVMARRILKDYAC